MKSQLKLAVLALLSAFSFAPSNSLHGATTIDPVNKFTYGANLGWLDWRGDITNGAVIGEYVCAGYIYGANVGWISLGSGSPANQVQYQNNSATDFGVNHDGSGNLTGYAYSANVGWINFEQTHGQSKVDLLTGRLSGNVWSANVGWISLSNATAHVQTTSIAPGADTDSDGITDAWELTHTNSLGAFTATSDSDGDGVTDRDEYLAGTAPNNASSVLKITSITRGLPLPIDTTLTWNSVNTRFYVVQELPSFSVGTWVDYLSNPVLGWNSAAVVGPSVTNQFFRVRAYRPLMP